MCLLRMYVYIYIQDCIRLASLRLLNLVSCKVLRATGNIHTKRHRATDVAIANTGTRAAHRRRVDLVAKWIWQLNDLGPQALITGNVIRDIDRASLRSARSSDQQGAGAQQGGSDRGWEQSRSYLQGISDRGRKQSGSADNGGFDRQLRQSGSDQQGKAM